MSDKTGTTSRPNLVFIFADQMRGMDMGCAGNHQIHTPNLDRLAGEGIRFSNAVSCLASCTPHRACLISGRYPTTTGVLSNDVPLPIDGKGIGHALRAGGYKTGWVGKWHLFGPAGYRRTFMPPGEHRHGFDALWVGVNCTHDYLDGWYYLNDDPSPVRFYGYEPDIQTDISLQYISEHKNNPFSLFLSYGPPHDPYHTVPNRWKDMYDLEMLEFRPNVPRDIFNYPTCVPGCCKPVDTYLSPEEVVEWHKRYGFDKSIGRGSMPNTPDLIMLRDYYAAISALDHNVGRILDHLEQCGIADNTIVVFTSDHGDMLFSQGAFQKVHPWEESINVPFILRYPKEVPAGTTSRPFNTPDIMPTLMELLGLPVPDYCEGMNFAPLIRGEAQKTPDAAYIMCPWEWNLPAYRGIRTERYTYAESMAAPIILYDNQEDPCQLRNLIDDTHSSELLKNLKKQCHDLAENKNIPFESWSVISRRLDEVNRAWVERYGETIKPTAWDFMRRK
ncbi:MAG: sulfatase [Spirochaetota bacterium]